MDDDKFRLEAHKLIRQEIADRSHRMDAVNLLIDSYVDFNGSKPSDDILEELADYILREELTDSFTFKVMRDEYPILSDSQMRRRSKVVPLSYVDDVASDNVSIVIYETDDLLLKHEIDAEVERYNEINGRQPVDEYNLIDKIGEDSFRKKYAAESDSFLLFRGKEHAEWSLNVRRRDGFTCQKCGKHSRKGMHAHHIESYNTALDLRYDINNGITLCERCHREFHAIYGKGYNTREQLDEWMEGSYFEL